MLPILSQLQFWTLLSICTWLSLTPQPPSELAAFSDKFLHSFAWLVLYLSCSLPYRRRYSSLTRFLLLLAASLLIEVGQYFVPGRDCSLLDLAANAFGLGIGVICERWWFRFRRG